MSTIEVEQVAKARTRRSQILSEAVRFILVGAVAYVVDVGLFNALTLTVLSSRPLTAKTISTVAGVAASYALNREFTWRGRARVHSQLREITLYGVVSAVGLALNLACLAFSEYVLGERSLLARNLSANVIGVAVAMVWRFAAYRRWVFPQQRTTGVASGSTRGRGAPRDRRRLQGQHN